ncbi:hypothetical protein [Pseudomonas aeruginosa]|uniref:hypothetical protein n=1 Tax=Pseudomonas aeruginosa TaxID=287 RepID=UPI0028807CCD|nr:hypothetical protein [Pseudomonas aeruginosa]
MSPAQDELIVTVNAGSSSIKTGLFAGRQGEEQPRLLARGKLDGIGVVPRLQIVMADGTVVKVRESEINQKGKARKLWDIEEGKGI